jgi:hypothetical protein
MLLKICHHFAGLDLADADVLRRAMSGKFRSRKEFDRISDKFLKTAGNGGIRMKSRMKYGGRSVHLPVIPFLKRIPHLMRLKVTRAFT